MKIYVCTERIIKTVKKQYNRSVTSRAGGFIRSLFQFLLGNAAYAKRVGFRNTKDFLEKLKKSKDVSSGQV